MTLYPACLIRIRDAVKYNIPKLVIAIVSPIDSTMSFCSNLAHSKYFRFVSNRCAFTYLVRFSMFPAIQKDSNFSKAFFNNNASFCRYNSDASSLCVCISRILSYAIFASFAFQHSSAIAWANFHNQLFLRTLGFSNNPQKSKALFLEKV